VIDGFESVLVPNRKVGGKKLLTERNCFLKVGKGRAGFAHFIQ
jgi:hypothetical protein